MGTALWLGTDSSVDILITMADTASAAKHRPRTVALMNQKGGVGKTTTAVNLGAAIAEAGRRVCLIDLDPQAHLTLHLGIDHEQIKHTTYDLLVDPDCPAANCLVTAAPNLDVIPSEVDLAAAEIELAGRPDRQQILSMKFAAIEDRYDVVLIDCPPSLGLLTLNALALAGEVLVPLQAHFLALQGLGKLLETVGLIRQSVNSDLRVAGIILCMHEKQTSLAKEVVADLESFFQAARSQDVPWRDCQVLRPVVRRNIKLAEAPSFGQTIFDYAPWCAGANDYRILAQRLIEAWDVQTESACDKAQASTTIEVTSQLVSRPRKVPTPQTASSAGAQRPRGMTEQRDF